MKKFLPILLLFLQVFGAKAQTTITASYVSSVITFSTGVSYITFAVKNNNNYPIILSNMTCVQANLYENNVYTLLYSSTSLAGAPIIPSAAWNTVATSIAPITTSTVTQVVPFDCIGLTIPPFTTYRFALQGSKGTAVRGGVTPNSFSAGGVNLLVGDNVATGGQVGFFGWQTLGPIGTPYFFEGSITFVTPGALTDLQIRTITKPTSVCSTASNNVSVQVCNKSGQNLNFGTNNANVALSVNGPGGVQNATIPFTSGALPPCGCVSATSPFNFSAPGNYSITATGTLSGVTEFTLLNNGTSDSIRNYKPVIGNNDSVCQFTNGSAFPGLTASGCIDRKRSISANAALASIMPLDGSSDATAGFFATGGLPFLPPDVTITGGSLFITNLNANATGSFGNEARFNMYSNSLGGPASPLIPGVAGNFLNFSIPNFDYKSNLSAAQVTNLYNVLGGGGMYSVGYWESVNNAAIASDVQLNAQGIPTTLTLTVDYTINPEVYWYTAASGGASFYHGSTMNPFIIPGSGLSSTANTGLYTFYAACSADTNCRVPITLLIKPSPAVFQDTLMVCENIAGGSNGTFDLTTITNTVSGGNPLAAVTYYQDLNLSLQISNPANYTSSTGPVYSKVQEAGCYSSDSVYLQVHQKPKFLNAFATGTVCSPATYDVTSLIDPFSIVPFGTDTFFYDDNTYTSLLANPNALAVSDSIFMVFLTNTMPACSDTALAVVNILPKTNYLIAQDTLFNYSNSGSQGCANINMIDGVADTLRTAYDCSRIVSIHDLSNGNSLGLTNVCTDIDATVMFHNGQPYVNRHYQITPTNNDSAEICLYYLNDDFIQYNNVAIGNWPLMPTQFSPFDASNICIAQIDNGDLNTPGHTVTTIPNSALNIQFDTASTVWSVCFKVDSFSYFYCHACNPFNFPLSVQLSEFTAEKYGSSAILQWQTTAEKNHSYFVVERSENGIDYLPISVNLVSKAFQGNSEIPLQYSFTDAKPLMGKNYYRLRIVDANNAFTYSTVRTLYYSENAWVQVYPNPVNDVVHIDIVTAKATKVVAKIMDVTGRTVHQINMSLFAGTNQHEVNMQSIKSGIYQIRIESQSEVLHTQSIQKR